MINSKSFITIAITSPDYIEDEARKIISLLESGNIDYCHIRKPNSSEKEVEELIKKIPETYHPSLKLHDYYSLLGYYDLGGVHLNARNKEIPLNAKAVSKSCHSLVELENIHDFDYVTLSPVFNSISKQGYNALFNFEELKTVLKKRQNVVALGGVTPDKIPFLKNLGFFGAAMLGYFWN